MALKKQIDTKGILERSRKLHQVLIVEGFAVGIVAGLVTILYRFALTYADKALQLALSFSRNHVWAIVGWFGVLILLAVLCGKLMDWEPLASGSGIPQLEGKWQGKSNRRGGKLSLRNSLAERAGMLGGCRWDVKDLLFSLVRWREKGFRVCWGAAERKKSSCSLAVPARGLGGSI